MNLVGDSTKKIPESGGESMGESIAVLQTDSPESSSELFLEYKRNLQPQNKDFSQEEKNRLLEKIQDLENEIQNILNENQDDSDRKVLDEDQKLKLYMNAVHKISPLLRKTIVAKEDKFFYSHPGVNPFAVTRAFFKNLFRMKVTSGASTISMQVARALQPASSSESATSSRTPRTR